MTEPFYSADERAPDDHYPFTVRVVSHVDYFVDEAAAHTWAAQYGGVVMAIPNGGSDLLASSHNGLKGTETMKTFRGWAWWYRWFWRVTAAPTFAALLVVSAQAAGIDTREHDPAGCVRLWADALLSRRSTPYLNHMRALKNAVYPKTAAFDFVAYECQIDRALVGVIACDEWNRIAHNEPPGPGFADDATPDECREESH